MQTVAIRKSGQGETTTWHIIDRFSYDMDVMFFDTENAATNYAMKHGWVMDNYSMDVDLKPSLRDVKED